MLLGRFDPKNSIARHLQREKNLSISSFGFAWRRYTEAYHLLPSHPLLQFPPIHVKKNKFEVVSLMKRFPPKEPDAR